MCVLVLRGQTEQGVKFLGCQVSWVRGNCEFWEIGTELGSSGGASCALNHRAISAALPNSLELEVHGQHFYDFNSKNDPFPNTLVRIGFDIFIGLGFWDRVSHYAAFASWEHSRCSRPGWLWTQGSTCFWPWELRLKRCSPFWGTDWILALHLCLTL